MLNVEVMLDPFCTSPVDQVKERLEAVLSSSQASASPQFRALFGGTPDGDEQVIAFIGASIPQHGSGRAYSATSVSAAMLTIEDAFLASVVVRATVESAPRPTFGQAAESAGPRFNFFVYQPHDDGHGEEMEDDGEAGNSVPLAAYQHWSLPNTEFADLWGSLVLEPGVKDSLVQYAQSMLLFGDLGVNSHLVSWNRVILLHGPPGTGKTTLCRGLAQKLAVRLHDRYPSGCQLIEVNAHSLFSKWFSESGKLVMKLFRQIRELLEDPDALVCVLIDEVESLVAARSASLNAGTEPSDAIRVVNAMLTQLDQLRHHRNVFVLTTSNITGAIDVAFVDRADIKQFLGPPSVAARYTILRSCVRELQRVGLVASSPPVVHYRSVQLLQTQSASQPTETDPVLQCGNELLRISERIEGASGRSLRKLPVIAHARFLSQVLLSTAAHHQSGSACSVMHFLQALSLAADHYQTEEARLCQ